MSRRLLALILGGTSKTHVFEKIHLFRYNTAQLSLAIGKHTQMTNRENFGLNVLKLGPTAEPLLRCLFYGI